MKQLPKGFTFSFSMLTLNNNPKMLNVINELKFNTIMIFFGFF